MACILRALGVVAGLAVAACAASTATNAGLDTTASQHVCWVFDQAITVVDHAAQISQAQALVLNGSVGSPQVPEQVVNQLRVAAQLMTDFRGWVGSLTDSLDVLFKSAHTTSGDLERAVADLDTFLSKRVPVTTTDVRSSGLWSAGTWTEHCNEHVLVKPFLFALDRLAEQVLEADVVLVERSRRVFDLRSERASAAGVMAACEEAADVSVTAHGETLAGVFNASRAVDALLWKDASLRRKVELALAANMNHSWRRTLVDARPTAHRLAERRQEAAHELKRVDKALLDGARALQEAAEERESISEKMRLHLKSMLTQCLPPPDNAPRSRYARFAASSLAADAVQLTFETAQFLQSALAGPLPSLMEALRDTVAELRASTAGTALGSFKEPPLMAQWWKWLPQKGADEPALLGLADILERFQRASSEHDEQLSSGGRAAALHSMWLRWREIGQPSPADNSAARNESKVLATGWWSHFGLS